MKRIPLFAVLIVLALGTFWAFERGGNDFNVFYEAFRIALSGKADFYRATPDRYLYAPGFAWLLAPLGLLPRAAALGLWCLLKSVALILVLRLIGRRAHEQLGASPQVGYLAALVCAKPLLIDFQYGQVNTLIFASMAWALLGTGRGALRWLLLGLSAAIKLYPLPLLCVAGLRGLSSRTRSGWTPLLAAMGGIALIVVLPLFFLPAESSFRLFDEWRHALFQRGFPTESHNQSMAGLWFRYFSGEKIHIIAYGMQSVALGGPKLPAWALSLIHSAWFGAALALLLASLWRSAQRGGLVDHALAIGAILLPMHLVWKPYFILSIALSACCLAFRDGRSRIVLGVAFIAFNLTGFDVVGYRLAGYLESASILMLAHVTLLAYLAVRSRSMPIVFPTQ